METKLSQVSVAYGYHTGSEDCSLRCTSCPLTPYSCSDKVPGSAVPQFICFEFYFHDAIVDDAIS